VEVDLEEHDRLMAPVLGMAHVLSIGFVEAMIRFGIPFERLSEVASVTFRKQIGTTREVVSENPHLYYEIQERNAFTGEVIRALVGALEKIRESVDRGDAARFESILREGRAYFGSAPPPMD
jgi:prephenate dehydrogenase